MDFSLVAAVPSEGKRNHVKVIYKSRFLEETDQKMIIGFLSNLNTSLCEEAGKSFKK